jgi:hypothetical protein
MIAWSPPVTRSSHRWPKLSGSPRTWPDQQFQAPDVHSSPDVRLIFSKRETS